VDGVAGVAVSTAGTVVTGTVTTGLGSALP
jgi:hypothetical protein